MDSSTLLIDPETRDLVFDENGFLETVSGKDAIAQNVRHALLTWKNEFFADEGHGTDYEQIMGLNQNDIEYNEVEAIIREAIFQDPDVARVDDITITYLNRVLTVEISMVTTDGDTISLEVNA